jgi:uncharacterized repeat protein (TIGR03803 family)
MPGKSSHRMLSAMLVLLVFGALLGAAWAQTETVLYSFCAQANCADGANPVAGLVFDQNGNLYGTTVTGGAYEQGVVFKLTPKGRETVLYSFCAQSNCTDGAAPSAGLVFDQDGNLYGTTDSGGAHGGGTVFKLTPKGKETVLYSFCAQTNCADGLGPWAGLVFDNKRNLYGTTYQGGANNGCGFGVGCGVVFKVTPEGKETVLYNFCSQTNCTDGTQPQAGLILDQKGNLYGTTQYGGKGEFNCTNFANCGVVFKLTPQRKETVLYSFNGAGYGAQPYAGLVFDQNGNLYGTTASDSQYPQQGIVFKLTPRGKETVLYGFCLQDCTDGSEPYAGVVFDQKGNLYGTTDAGGASGHGVVFKLTPEGKETVLHSFCSQNKCTDGMYPYAGLVSDQIGNLYGTTVGGGPYGRGVVFKLTPTSRVR